MLGVKTSVRCSFCGKRKDDVAKLIAGPGVYICDECVGVCDDILANKPLQFSDWDIHSDDELIAEMVRVNGSHPEIDAAVAQIVQHLRDRRVT